MEDWNNDGKIDAEDEIYQELIIFDDTDFFNDDGRGAKRSPRSSHPASSKSPKKGQTLSPQNSGCGCFSCFSALIAAAALVSCAVCGLFGLPRLSAGKKSK